MVTGGRQGWWRALAFTALVLSGCGARTSSLDADAYDRGGLGASGGGGRGSGGGAGAGPVPGGGGGGFDPSLATAPCQAYCPGYGAQCPANLNGEDCVAACQRELNDAGARCQALGIEAVRCLTPFFTPGGADCQAAATRGLAVCGQLADEFRRCKQGAPSSQMVPTSPPRLDVTASCQQVESIDTQLGCLEIYACEDQGYIVQCTGESRTSPLLCTCGANQRSFANGVSCKEAARALCQ